MKGQGWGQTLGQTPVGWFGNLGNGQLSYNPGKVGGFGNLGTGQSSDNPRKVGGFTHAKGIAG